MASKSSTKRNGVQRLGANTYHIASGGGALVTFATLTDNATIDTGRIANHTDPRADRQIEIMNWGASNDVPNYREELITGNNIVPALIERKRNIICGQGWYAYREKFQDGGSGMMKRVVDEVPMGTEQEAFFRAFKKVGRHIAGEIMKHGIALPEFVRDKGGQIISVKSLEVKYCRAAKKNAAGEIDRWYWGNIWPSSMVNQVQNADRLVRDLPVYTGDPKQMRFILPVQDDLFNDNYYPIPAYWGGRHWITLSNIIPLFHEANLRNGAMPRWNVIIPHDYFYDYEAMNGAATVEDRATLLKEFQQREQQFIDDFNEVMTDISKTGRTLVTKSEIVEAIGAANGKEKRILIEPLVVDMKDKALLELYAASNVANISAQAIHPTLANIETQGRLSSGTEIRNAFLMYLVIAAPAIRDMLQEVVDLVKRENGWPADIHYAIRDAELTTLADNPAGVRPAETQIGAE